MNFSTIHTYLFLLKAFANPWCKTSNCKYFIFVFFSYKVFFTENFNDIVDLKKNFNVFFLYN